MMAEHFSPALLDMLVDDLRPVRPVRDRTGLMLVAIVLAGGVGAVILLLGARADLRAGTPNAMFLLRSGVLLLLGGIAAASAVASARPGIGRADRGWRAALAVAGVFPVAALIALAMDWRSGVLAALRPSMIECLGVSLVCGLAVGAAIVLWLRRGAPASPVRTGLVTGIAAGSLGAFAYAFHCPQNDIVYVGLWNGLTVAVAALFGRAAVPALIRW